MNKRMARTTELYKNPDLIIPQNTIAHYSANTWIVRTPQDEIYFLDFSGAVLAPEEDDTAEEAFRLYDREYRVIVDRAMILLTLAVNEFKLIGVKEEDVLSEEMLELVKQEAIT